MENQPTILRSNSGLAYVRTDRIMTTVACTNGRHGTPERAKRILWGYGDGCSGIAHTVEAEWSPCSCDCHILPPCHCGKPSNDYGNGIEYICEPCLMTWQQAGEPEECPCSILAGVL